MMAVALADSGRKKRLAAWMLRGLLVITLILVGGGLLMLGLERRLIYFPSRDITMQPDALGLIAEDITARTTDGETIHGWWIRRDRRPDSRRPTLLLSHGNAGTISDRLHRVAHFQKQLDVDVVLYDYRGYGKSSGSPTEQGTYEDSRAVYDWLTTRGVSPDRIVLFGESLGCAVSVQLAIDRRARGLVLEAPFVSIRAMAKVLLPWLPLTGLLRTHYDNEAKIGRVAIPLLVFHGTNDEVIPFAQGETVFRAASAKKQFVPIKGAHHNDVYVVGGQSYLDALSEFLRSLPELNPQT